MAAYGWPFVMYRYCGTGLFRLLKEVTCCSCFRPKTTMVTDDNCCLCHLAGVKHISRIREEDILFASFRNHVFEVRQWNYLVACLWLLFGQLCLQSLKLYSVVNKKPAK